MYQYLAWFKKGQSYPSGNRLLSLESVNKLKSTLLGTGVEVHESVQRYDSLGKVLFTPIYADFDGLDKRDEVIKFIEMCELEFKLTPDIYFSGNRGYHLFINIPVSHAHPHLVVRRFMTIMCESLAFDDQMYGARHLLRSEGSVHFKTGKYKTRMTRAQFMDDVTVGNRQLVSQPTHHESRALELFIQGLGQIVDKEVAEAELKYSQSVKEQSGEVSPCIRALIDEGPVNGENNTRITLIARNMNSVGIQLEDALLEMSTPSWMTKHKEIEATLKSIYKRPSKFGCKGNDTLKKHCDPFCPFNEVQINIT